MKESLIGLYNVLIPGINSIPKVFGKNFIKERYYLHFFISLVLTFLSVRLLVTYAHFNDLPTAVKITIGWMGAYAVNFFREWWYGVKGNKFDYLDIHAGAYGGIIGTVIYILLH